MKAVVKFVLLVILQILPFVFCHPQCLNYEGPFIPTKPLKFCTLYSDIGCCSFSDDQAQKDIYDSLKYEIRTVNKGLWEKCSGYVKDFLCQTCSPYAAHSFDAEVTGKGNNVVVRYFPGICKKYCNKFFRTCTDILEYYMPNNKKYKKEKQNLLRVSKKRFPTRLCKFVKTPDNDYCFPNLLDNDVLNGDIVIEQDSKEGCLCVKEIATGLIRPVFGAHRGDGSNTLFVGEQIGVIRIIKTDEKNNIMPVFMNMEEIIHGASRFGDERGLLNLAFHPDHQNNGKFYVVYTIESTESGFDHNIRISEFKVMADNIDKGDISTERVILEIPQPWANHNGGNLFFGEEDNYLYLTTGDGGRAGDPLYLSQNMSVLIGKIIRIDIDKTSDGKEYAIPPDNPFVKKDGVRPEIYTYGMRNPWRCGQDPGDRDSGEGQGRVICGDVGQGHYEELDLILKGGNYGWSAYEGNTCYRNKKVRCDAVRNDPNYKPPIHVYSHEEGKCVIGGNFYRGCTSPNLNGDFFYGDMMTGKLYRLVEEEEGWVSYNVTMCGPDKCVDLDQGSYNPFIYSFAQDEQGEVYFLSSSERGISQKTGAVFKLVDPARRGDPESC